MKLVEDDATHPVECRIVGHATTENALGHYFNARFTRNFPVEAYLIAHSLAYRFVQQLCHAYGNLSGGNASRFKHDDAPLWYGAEHGERQQGRFTGTGRCNDNGTVALGQCGIELPCYRCSWQ